MPCMECGRCSQHIWKGRCPVCYMRDYRGQRRYKNRTCEACKVEFTTTRVDARFCSRACRQRAYRDRVATGALNAMMRRLVGLRR
jgi:hypothetical protein